MYTNTNVPNDVIPKAAVKHPTANAGVRGTLVNTRRDIAGPRNATACSVLRTRVTDQPRCVVDVVLVWCWCGYTVASTYTFTRVHTFNPQYIHTYTHHIHTHNFQLPHTPTTHAVKQ